MKKILIPLLFVCISSSLFSQEIYRTGLFRVVEIEEKRSRTIKTIYKRQWLKERKFLILNNLTLIFVYRHVFWANRKRDRIGFRVARNK